MKINSEKILHDMGNKLHVAYGGLRKLKNLPPDASDDDRKEIVSSLESALKSVVSLRKDLVTAQADHDQMVPIGHMRDILLEVVASLWSLRRRKYKPISGNGMDTKLQTIARSINETLLELHEQHGPPEDRKNENQQD